MIAILNHNKAQAQVQAAQLELSGSSILDNWQGTVLIEPHLKIVNAIEANRNQVKILEPSKDSRIMFL